MPANCRQARDDDDVTSRPARAEALAVVLNANARRVDRRIVAAATALFGRQHVYCSHSLAEAEQYARLVVQRGYTTVVCGGGDGTLIGTYNLIQRYVDEANLWRHDRLRRHGEKQEALQAPRLAFLSLGTGNGLRQVGGAGDPLADLQRLAQHGPRLSHRSIPLIVGPGNQYFTFGGLGYDSLLLADYNRLKEHPLATAVRPVAHSVAGYFAAVLTRTLPRALLAKPLLAKICARGSALFVDPQRGDTPIELPTSATLYSGPVSMVAAGTTPYFGYGMQMFPFAYDMPGMMQLRVAKVAPLQALWNLPQVWRGVYRNPAQMFDFLCGGVDIELSRPFPFQHSGDDQGLQRHLRLEIAKQHLKLVELSSLR